MHVYFTLGQLHTHSVNGKTLDKDCVVCVTNHPTEKSARDAFVEVTNNLFHESFTKLDEKTLEYYPRGVIEIEI